jgi:hypothetical protein
MSIARPSRAALLPLALITAAALSGCFGARLAADEPAGARLQGVWKLNRAASDDPQQIVERLRAEATRKVRRAMSAQGMANEAGPGPGGPGRGQGRRGQGGAASGEPPDELPPQGLGPGMDPLRNSPTMHALRDVMQRSEYLTIRQSPEQISFDYGTTTRSYTPGGRSVVSSENGVADQTSGWSGKKYVILIRPQLGPAFSEEYSLSPNGKQLIVKTQIGPFELSKVNLTRVYDATDAVVPNSGPSNE